ncbi:MAG: hypothetical protein ABI591_23935 [Kofleriaceae bacterium]
MRSHAEDIEHDFVQRRAFLAFNHVMASKPNAARRDAAAVQMMHDASDPPRAVVDAATAGAFGPVAAADLGSSSIYGRLEPAFAAIAVGDLTAARAAIARGEPRGFDGTVQSASLACLLGERARGLALLRLAAAERERLSGTPDSEVRIAAQHCGGTVDNVGFDPYVVPSFGNFGAVVARLFDPAVEAGRRAAIGAILLRQSTIFRANWIAAFALAADGAREATPVELLEMIASPYAHDLELDGMFDVTPWSMWGADHDREFADYVPPPWLELAASRYAHAALLAPARLDPDEVEISEPAALAPRETLRAAAALAYQFAAGYRLRRGDRAGARSALEMWRALAPGDRRRAPLEVEVGDPAMALATLDAWHAAQHGAADPGLQELADFTRVFALAATGAYADAHALAKALHGRAASWLLLATAIASGAPVAGLLSKPAATGGDGSPESLLAAIEAKQPVNEVGYLGPEDRAALPAVMVVIAHAAQVAGQDPEVVLDRAFATQMPSRTIARARAEAARWRKDVAAARLWQTRAEAIEKLFVDDHAVVLAGIARLW